jgi:ketosteroid isomerase-like protein
VNILDKGDRLSHISVTPSVDGGQHAPDGKRFVRQVKGSLMKRQQKAQIERLFGAFISGSLDVFLSGCARDLVVTSRGTSPVATTLIRSDIPDWFGSLQALAPTSLRSSVEVAQVEQNTATVILRHAFSRHGIDYRLETVNLVSFCDGLLAEWSSYPLDLAEYGRAWQTKERDLLQPV